MHTAPLDRSSAFTAFMPPSEVNYHIHISLQNSYIFVEVPKVACSTLKRLLQEIEARTAGTPIPAPDMATIHNKRLSSLLSPAEVGWEKFEQLLNDRSIFKFCFVRNPYSRLLSAYLSKLRWREGKYFQQVSQMLGVESDTISFEQFVQAIEMQRSIEMDPHWRIQTDQIFDSLIAYDFIGRFETLSQDIEAIVQRIAPPSIQPQLQIEHSGSHRSGRATNANAKLQAFYRDTSVRERVKQIYSVDFTKFDYSPVP